jgi:hypothetical protein
MMRMLYVLACFFLVVANVSALSLQNKDDAGIVNLESSNLEYKLGIVKRGEVVKKTIKIENKLNEAIEIKSARVTCDCMEVNANPQMVKKNGIFELGILFDSAGIDKDIKELEEVVYILTTNKKYEIIRLVILATITEPN